uniref:hypothetical protein n=1 Tax=Alistipes sp. TaxID=1872444 RepID=UPI0040567880
MLQKSLRRLRLTITLSVVALTLCIAWLILKGYNTLLCTLCGLLGVQLLFNGIILRETTAQLQSTQELEEEEKI